MSDESKKVLVGELSPEGIFALGFARVCVQDGWASHRGRDFLNKFEKVFGQPFFGCPRVVWEQQYNKGIEELVSLRVIEVRRTAEGTYVPTKINEENIEDSSILSH